MKADSDRFLTTLLRAFEADQPAREALAWWLLGALLVAAIVFLAWSSVWIFSGGLRRACPGKFGS